MICYNCACSGSAYVSGHVVNGRIARAASQVLMQSRYHIADIFWGVKIFVSSEFLASSWKNFHGCGILNHTPVLCSTVLWVKISWLASQP